MVCATVEGLFARCKQNEPNKMTFMHGEGEAAAVFDVPLDRDFLNQEAKQNSFFSYVAGA